MRRVNLFLIILITAIAALITLTAIGFAIFTSNQSQSPYNWMSQMWGGSGTGNTGMSGMMGGIASTSNNSLLPYFGALFAVMIGLTVAGIVGLGYYLLYPQMKMGAVQTQAPIQTATMQTADGATPIETVSKTLTDEELKVINVLNAHNGKYLQKYIRSETGLSRLKTHRIVARLAERGIVSLEKTGNTNQVFLASWLQQQNKVN